MVDIKNWLLGIVGAVIGGVAGYFITRWIVGQGFYALVVPGALLGIGCGFLSGAQSNAIGGCCAVAALGLGLFTEWSLFPFIADDSLGFFLTNLSELKPMSWIMIALGVYCGWSFGRGRPRGGAVQASKGAE